MSRDDRKILALTEETLHALERGAPLAPLVEATTRVARLLGDYRGLYRLSLESKGIGQKELNKQLIGEVLEHLDLAEAEAVRDAALKDFFEERAMKTGPLDAEDSQVHAGTVAELELLEEGSRETQEAGPWNRDLAESHHSLQRIVSRIRTRLHQYLSRVETSLEVGQASEDIFVQNRAYVESRLAQVSPATLEALAAAENRAREGGSEARSQALTSCRRALKQLVDDLYPATGCAVECFDGRTREMTEERYIQRLIQFAYENLSSETDLSLLIAQLEKLSAYIGALAGLANKGVHDHVSAYEVNQCIIQTFLTVGDFLRMRDQTQGSST